MYQLKNNFPSNSLSHIFLAADQVIRELTNHSANYTQSTRPMVGRPLLTPTSDFKQSLSETDANRDW